MVPQGFPPNLAKVMETQDLKDVSWEVPYKGKTSYSAFCEVEVVLISQDEHLQVADAVPRRSCELTEDDKKQLERLDISLDSEYDDASIMAARYALDKRFTNIRIERSKPGSRLNRSRVLKIIRDAMKTSTKPASK